MEGWVSKSDWNDVFVDRCWRWWFMVGKMWSLWLKPQKRSWIYSSPALFSKLLIRRCQIGGFKRKTCFLQKNYKSLAKATYWASSSSNLASTSCTHVCFVEFLFFIADCSQRWIGVLRWHRLVVWVFQVAAWGGLGAGWLWLVYGRPLRPYLILVV